MWKFSPSEVRKAPTLTTGAFEASALSLSLSRIIEFLSHSRFPYFRAGKSHHSSGPIMAWNSLECAATRPPSLKNGTTRKRSCQAGRVWIRNFLARWPEMKSSTQKNEMFDHMGKAPPPFGIVVTLMAQYQTGQCCQQKKGPYKTDETSDWLQFGGIAVWRLGRFNYLSLCWFCGSLIKVFLEEWYNVKVFGYILVNCAWMQIFALNFGYVWPQKCAAIPNLPFYTLE